MFSTKCYKDNLVDDIQNIQQELERGYQRGGNSIHSICLL